MYQCCMCKLWGTSLINVGASHYHYSCYERWKKNGHQAILLSVREENSVRLGGRPQERPGKS